MNEKFSRINVDALDNILHQPFSVLDKGEIRVIEYMGTDSTIVNAARISYGAGTTVKRDDKALINYLLRNKHTSPFEMCEIILYIKLPIFVAAQWIRHRTASVNGYSARYSEMQDEFYVPSAEQIKAQAEHNKQSSGDILPLEIGMQLSDSILEHSEQSYLLYRNLLANGVSRELARMVLPQNIYTSWYWKIDLHNLLHFLTLRLHAHAQAEIRAYAEIIAKEIVAKWVPLTYDAFDEHRIDAVNLSKKGQKIINDHVEGKLKTREEYHVGKGEWSELLQLLRIM